jgi:predicted transposase YbfD/YdcC
MSEFAKSKEEFLKTFLDLPNGIPSKDTINRVFSAIDSEQFEAYFIEWVSSILSIKSGQTIAIDGKTVRGAKNHGKKSPIHLVSAWSNENNLVLGQVKTDEKSNEITAIPQLLDILFIEGNTITIDAMGAQKEIAQKIIDKKGDYVLAIKANQPEMWNKIQDEFRFYKPKYQHTTIDAGHGRIETRYCSVITDFQFIEKDNPWPKLKSIIKVESIREFKNSSKKPEKSVRYYISSKEVNAEDFLRIVRNHWAIENKLHWILDVGFSEDASRKRTGNAARNYSLLLKIALNLLKNEKTEKQSIKTKRLKTAWDNDYMLKVLNIKV